MQGVDVWLNTPRRPLEASGTSGQKAVLNGGAQPVGARRLVGRGLRRPQRLRHRRRARVHAIAAAQDAADAESLYHLLEDEIVPLYYLERSADHLPGEWIGRAKESIRTLAPRFSMRRMVREYVDSMYLPALPEPEPAED